MSLNYELFINLHRNKYKNSSDVEIDMIKSAKDKYEADLKDKFEKNDISNIQVFNYLNNQLIKENTIKLMIYCEDNFKNAYSKNIFKNFLINFKSISKSNNDYVKYMNNKYNINFKLEEFKDTDFLRLSELIFRSLHEIYLSEKTISKGMNYDKIKNYIVKNLNDEIIFNNIYKEHKNLIIKKLNDNKFSSYEHYRTSVIFTLNKLEINKINEVDSVDMHKIAIFLLDFFTDNCSNLFFVETYSKKVKNNIRSFKTIKFSDEYLNKTNELLKKFGDSFINYKPMLVEPKDWSNCFDGGYLTQKLNLVKASNKTNQYINDNFDITNAINAVNILQKTPFRINKKVHEVMYNLFHNSNNIFGLNNKIIPVANIDLDSVQRDKILDKNYDDLNKKDKKKYMEEKAKYSDRKYALITYKKSTESKRQLMNTILKISAEYYDNNIYFPYQIDTRNRFYPVAKFLNPQGNDYAKGLLELGNGRKLTKESIIEYKKHIANIFAIDKIDKKEEKEKIKWVDNHSKEILESALNPYKNLFWTKADKPFQALAACFEYEKICKFKTNYISYAYIDIDGSTNGLQQYSSLLLDKKMAILTNLYDNEKNEDCYEYIAQKCIEYIKENEINFTKEEKDMINKIKLSGLNRKLLKRPVMTTSYSATVNGWTKQMTKVIKDKIDEGEIENYFSSTSEMYKSYYFFASKIVLKICEKELSAAFNTMKIIKKHVQTIHNVKKDADFMFFNPAGFIVTNNYKNKKSINVSYRFLKESKKIYFNEDTKENNIDKILNAICPNIIHSIDASHMCLVLIDSYKNNIKDFVMVHDSFGCHPNDMITLRKIVKDVFIKMHTENNLYNIIKNMYDFNCIEFDKNELKEDCKRGDFDLKMIKKAKFDFC